MANFDYVATDRKGRDVAGQIDASDAHQATSQLEQQGLTVLNLSLVGPAADRRRPLSPEQAEQVVGHVAQLSAAELPLTEGLRAAAEESGEGRVADVLRSIAAETERGRSLEDVLGSSEDVFPPHISGLVLAAARTGELGGALTELVEHQRAARALQRSIRSAFAYPLLVLCLAVVVLLFIVGYAAGVYDELLEEFGFELPLITRVLFWWRRTGIWLAIAIGLVAAAACVFIRIRVGPAAWLRLLSTLPLLGPLWHWQALAEWLGLMSVLIKHEIPLPEALRLAAAGGGNANVCRLSAELAERTGQGQSVCQAMSVESQFPRSLVPLVRWGEQAGMLSEAFATGHEMFAERTRTRALLLQTVLPPVLFIAIGCSVLFVVGALFAPIGSLIQGLSRPINIVGAQGIRYRFDEYWLVIGPLAPLVAGFALLWALAGTRRTSTGSGPSLIRVALTALAWVLLLLGLFALVGLLAHFAFLLAWIVTAVILGSAVHRYRSAERHSLLWVLSAAADRGVPLETAARAFADERDDVIGVRSVILAEFLEAGVPLSLALRRSRHRLPPAALLAADLGQETGTLGPALRQVAKQLDQYEVTLRWAAEKLFYLGFLMLFTAATVTFLMIKIVPVFQYMLDEMGMEAPAPMRWLIEATRFFSVGWFLFLPILALSAGGLLLALLYYIGFSPRNLPVVGRIWRRVDSALILRWLAIAVRQNRSLVEFMRLLASYFPQPGLRRKLERAANRIGKGTHWCDALQRAGVIRAADGAIFKSAERTGNLAWALDEMADSSLRRSAYRVRGFVSVAFPLALIAFAGCVAAIIFGILFPLLSLIQGLA